MQNIVDSLKRIDEKKKKLDAAHPLPPELVQNLQEWLAVEFTYTSNAIEGNTLSFSETAIVVEKSIAIGGKTLREHLELIDCTRAVNFIIARAWKKQAVTLDDICTIHTMVSQKIDDSLNFADFMGWLHTTQDHPVILAALAHYKLATIHPFVDENGLPADVSFIASATEEALLCPPKLLAKDGAKEGRTARLLMNLLLLQHGYPLAIIQKEQRSNYIAAIEHARETDDYNPFYAVIIQAVEYSLDIYLEAIEQSNLL